MRASISNSRTATSRTQGGEDTLSGDSILSAFRTFLDREKSTTGKTWGESRSAPGRSVTLYNGSLQPRPVELNLQKEKTRVSSGTKITLSNELNIESWAAPRDHGGSRPRSKRRLSSLPRQTVEGPEATRRILRALIGTLDPFPASCLLAVLAGVSHRGDRACSVLSLSPRRRSIVARCHARAWGEPPRVMFASCCQALGYGGPHGDLGGWSDRSGRVVGPS